MKTKSAGELEMSVMNLVWEKGECSVNTILENIQPEKKLAYTTVATVLQRLFEKGVIDRKEQGTHFIYYPTKSKVEYSSHIISSFLKKIVHNFGDVAITSFAESIENLPNKDKRKLLDLLKKNDNS